MTEFVTLVQQIANVISAFFTIMPGEAEPSISSILEGAGDAPFPITNGTSHIRRQVNSFSVPGPISKATNGLPTSGSAANALNALSSHLLKIPQPIYDALSEPQSVEVAVNVDNILGPLRKRGLSDMDPTSALEIIQQLIAVALQPLGSLNLPVSTDSCLMHLPLADAAPVASILPALDLSSLPVDGDATDDLLLDDLLSSANFDGLTKRGTLTSEQQQLLEAAIAKHAELKQAIAELKALQKSQLSKRGGSLRARQFHPWGLPYTGLPPIPQPATGPVAPVQGLPKPVTGALAAILDVAKPALSVATPPFDAVKPAPGPIVNVAKPVTDVTGSVVGFTKPALGLALPVVNVAAPVAEVLSSLLSAASSVTEAAGPVIDAVAPVLDPVISAAAPALAVASPVLDAAAPVTDAAKAILPVDLVQDILKLLTSLLKLNNVKVPLTTRAEPVSAFPLQQALDTSPIPGINTVEPVPNNAAYVIKPLVAQPKATAQKNFCPLVQGVPLSGGAAPVPKDEAIKMLNRLVDLVAYPQLNLVQGGTASTSSSTAQATGSGVQKLIKMSLASLTNQLGRPEDSCPFTTTYTYLLSSLNPMQQAPLQKRDMPQISPSMVRDFIKKWHTIGASLSSIDPTMVEGLMEAFLDPTNPPYLGNYPEAVRQFVFELFILGQILQDSKVPDQDKYDILSVMFDGTDLSFPSKRMTTAKDFFKNVWKYDSAVNSLGDDQDFYAPFNDDDNRDDVRFNPHSHPHDFESGAQNTLALTYPFSEFLDRLSEDDRDDLLKVLQLGLTDAPSKAKHNVRRGKRNPPAPYPQPQKYPEYPPAPKYPEYPKKPVYQYLGEDGLPDRGVKLDDAHPKLSPADLASILGPIGTLDPLGQSQGDYPKQDGYPEQDSYPKQDGYPEQANYPQQGSCPEQSGYQDQGSDAGSQYDATSAQAGADKYSESRDN
ncbi:hypothetical protein EK21DRAFT_106698 [Setomelanomma holmii]|uniref:Uncharacterized protein n=1 Tax=Setomelanomma holmii TaxID=210430 RepID=A0A9P4HIH3_9PLEO|nr:hypothetical protein EK21DRAFT_106698 [Setomelanomma holmii]